MSITRRQLAMTVGLLLFSHQGHAQELTEMPVTQKVSIVLMGEVLIAANAALAALDPQVYGVAGAILFPLAVFGGERGNPPTRWVSFVALESLAAYNITQLDKDEDSSAVIVRSNIIGWHAVFALALMTDYFTRDRDSDSAVAVQYKPVRGGGLLQLSYKF